jgi:uncharacterized membrane protein
MVYVPQFAPRESLKRPVAVWCAVAAGALGIIGLVLSAPLLAQSNHAFWASLIYESFGHICHQISERSFHLGEHKFAVCARCFGIYAGFAGGVLLYPLIRSLRRRDTPARVWLFIALIPICIDFALGFLGIWENTHWSRVTTGAVLGATAALYIVPGMVDLSYLSLRRFFARDNVQSNIAP